MKKTIVFLLLPFFLLTACSNQEKNQSPKLSSEHTMTGDIPCHQMSDGSWMGNCEAQNVLEGTEFEASSNHLPEALESQVVELNDGDRYTLTAEMVFKEIKGNTIKMLAYNRMIPGPMLKVKRGSTITIDFTNNTDEETMLHSHGLRTDNTFDGTALVQDPIPVGGSYIYELTFPDTGIYWYHPHIREDYAQELGLYGNYLVQSEDSNYWSPVNREIPLVLDDLLLENGQMAPFYKEFSTHTLMGRYGNTFLVNGSDDYQLDVKKGEVIRFFITNVSNARNYRLAFPGARMKLIGADAGKYLRETFVETIVLSPSERVVVELIFEKSGVFDLLNDVPNGSQKLGTIRVSDQNVEESYLKNFEELRFNSDVDDELSSFRQYFDRKPDKELQLTMSMDMSENMGNMDHQMMDHGHKKTENEKIEWQDDMGMMNRNSTNKNLIWKLVDKATGKENMDINWQFKKGDVVKIRLYNDPNSMHPMQHPIHLHGQRFLVLETNGVRHENLVWKDTVMVPAGDTMDIIVDMSNTGKWMLHCHIAEHLEADMMLGFEVL